MDVASAALPAWRRMVDKHTQDFKDLTSTQAAGCKSMAAFEHLMETIWKEMFVKRVNFMTQTLRLNSSETNELKAEFESFLLDLQLKALLRFGTEDKA